jgi:hypothetical protein
MTTAPNGFPSQLNWNGSYWYWLSASNGLDMCAICSGRICGDNVARSVYMRYNNNGTPNYNHITVGYPDAATYVR